MLDQLPKQLTQFGDTLTRFFADVLQSTARAINETNEIPQKVLDKVVECGPRGLAFREENGGLGISEFISYIALEMLMKRLGGGIFFLTPTWTATAINLTSAEGQRRCVLPNLARGRHYTASCRTKIKVCCAEGNLGLAVLWQGSAREGRAKS